MSALGFHAFVFAGSMPTLQDVSLVVTNVTEQLVPDRPFAIEPPASQGLETDLPAVGHTLFGHHGVAHLFLLNR
jgi:hypothetical protein